jgi:hypothetical protein
MVQLLLCNLSEPQQFDASERIEMWQNQYYCGTVPFRLKLQTECLGWVIPLVRWCGACWSIAETSKGGDFLLALAEAVKFFTNALKNRFCTVL